LAPVPSPKKKPPKSILDVIDYYYRFKIPSQYRRYLDRSSGVQGVLAEKGDETGWAGTEERWRRKREGKDKGESGKGGMGEKMEEEVEGRSTRSKRSAKTNSPTFSDPLTIDSTTITTTTTTTTTFPPLSPTTQSHLRSSYSRSQSYLLHLRSTLPPSTYQKFLSRILSFAPASGNNLLPLVLPDGASSLGRNVGFVYQGTTEERRRRVEDLKLSVGNVLEGKTRGLEEIIEGR